MDLLDYFLSFRHNVRLESPVEVAPSYYEQWARTRRVKEYDELNPPTFSLNDKRDERTSKKGHKKGKHDLEGADDDIPIEIQRLFLKHKISF